MKPDPDRTHPFPWKAAAPSMAVSTVLLAVTICAGSVLYVNHLANVAAWEKALDEFDAAVELEASIGDLRRRMSEYVLSGSPHALEELARLQDAADLHVTRLERVIVTPEGRIEVAEIRESFTNLNRRLKALAVLDQQARRERTVALLNEILDGQILSRAQHQRELTRSVVESMRAENNSLLKWTGWTLVILGLGGAAAGVSSGFSLARALQRQIVELSVTVRSAAGTLEHVGDDWTPIEVEPSEDLSHVQSMVNLLSERIGSVVQRLQAAERESMRQDQLAALGQLAAGLAHELRNPLTSIKTLVEAARSPGNSLDDGDLQVIDEELTRLDDTLQSFLDYARPPKLTRRLIDLRDVVERTVQLVGPRAERQFVDLRVELPDEPVQLVVDPEQLRQVLLNLVLNSLEAQGGGGNVTIHLRDDRHAGRVELSVVDDGPGIRADLLKRLFEPFVSSKPSGTGLGLTVCRRIVESHEGWITVENLATGGARFTVTLPRRPETADADTGSAALESAALGAGG